MRYALDLIRVLAAMNSMKQHALAMLTTIGISTLLPAAHSADFLLDKAADFYCASMEDLKPSEMTTYERGLMEGMAMGFVMGQYPEQADKLEKMDDEQFNKSFYPLIKKKCPGKSFL